jgi:pentatricopeptide repeat protein
MMDKPLWLQRFEDPDGMTEKERKQYTEEASLREKQFADAQAFDEFIAVQRQTMELEDARSKNADTFATEYTKELIKKEKRFQEVLKASSIVFVNQRNQWIDPEEEGYRLTRILPVRDESIEKAEEIVYTPERKTSVEALVEKSKLLTSKCSLNLAKQIAASELQAATQSIKSSVAKAEEEMEQWLLDLNEATAMNIKTDKALVVAKSEVELMPLLHHHVTETGRRDIIAAKRALNNAKYLSKLDIAAAEEIYKHNRPRWLIVLEQAQVEIVEGGYSANTAWRKCAIDAVKVLQGHLDTLRDNVSSNSVDKLWKRCHEFKKAINLLRSKDVRKRLNEFATRAISLSVDYNTRFKNAKSLLESEIYRTTTKVKKTKDDLLTTTSKLHDERSEILSRLHNARQHLQETGLLEGTSVLVPNGWRGVVYRPSLVQHDLIVANRMSRERHDRGKLRAYFMENLLLCGNAGAWQESFHLYAAMIGCRIVPDIVTFKYIFLSCKNSIPPQATRILRMMKEMHRVKLTGDRRIYHIIICTCAMAGDWRRAAIAFKSMLRDKVVPSADTYNMIIRTISSSCDPKDAPQIYDALKISGVPEKIAYAASLKSLRRYGREKEKKKYSRQNNKMRNNYF